MSVRCSTISPHKPPLTEENLPDQFGKLVKILYQRNAKIWLAARSQSKTQAVTHGIKAAHPGSSGDMIFLKLELDNLTTINSTAQEFLERENRLDVLRNNAGVMVPPQGVIWVSSSAADGAARPAIDFSNMYYHKEEGIWSKYSRSKAGNVLQAAEYARRVKTSGIISLSLNPGNFVTNLQQNMPKVQLAAFKLISHPPKNGAYTELFAGLDQSITMEYSGGWVSPFGKKENAGKDILDPELGGQYWEWCDAQIQPYLGTFLWAWVELGEAVKRNILTMGFPCGIPAIVVVC
ncbi:short-chain dehydrogenase [Colletotrichum phormii]|uniref:Short-chain dehydrogenase n=1 Tax=Colletotrichum phormii TaxID=359342 RepID=A0AAJ0A4Q7_9PEZI|nr:short-chain dehydrogenase [Colletotrichum phormii]KAK1656469.1 short-chain dehydrogenase [Colletotrichum phormii]